MSTGGSENLGRATYTIDGDDAPFEKAIGRARKGARDFTDAMEKEGRKRSRAAQSEDRESRRLEAQRLRRNSRLAMGLLQLSNVADDMQYGFRAVVNNIGPAVWMLTGHAGLGAAATMAGVAINQLTQHWDSLVNRLSAAWSGASFAQLEKLRVESEKAGQAFDKMMEEPSKAQAARMEAIKDAMLGMKGGVGDISNRLREEIAKGTIKGLEIAEPTEAEVRQKAFALQLGKLGQGRIAAIDPWAAAQGAVGALFFGQAADVMDEATREEAKRAVREDKIHEQVRTFMGRLFGAVFDEKAWRTFYQFVEDHARDLPKEFVDAIRKMQISPPEHREANRQAAAQILQGPLGFRLLQEGPGLAAARAPLDAERSMKMLMGHPIARRLSKATREKMVGAMIGMDPATAADALAGLNEKAMKAAGFGERTRAMPAMAGAGAMGAAFIPGGVPEPGLPFADAALQAFRARIGAAKAGPAARHVPDAIEAMVKKMIGGREDVDAAGIRAEMEEQQRDRLRATMLRYGVGEREARHIAAQEDMRRRFAPWQGGGGVADLLAKGWSLLGGTGEPDVLPSIAEKQLAELKAMRKVLDAQRQEDLQALSRQKNAAAAAGGGAVVGMVAGAAIP